MGADAIARPTPLANLGGIGIAIEQVIVLDSPFYESVFKQHLRKPGRMGHRNPYVFIQMKQLDSRPSHIRRLHSASRNSA